MGYSSAFGYFYGFPRLVLPGNVHTVCRINIKFLCFQLLQLTTIYYFSQFTNKNRELFERFSKTTLGENSRQPNSPAKERADEDADHHAEDLLLFAVDGRAGTDRAHQDVRQPNRQPRRKCQS